MATRGSNTEKLATAERRSQVLQLRRAGASFRAIAGALRERHGEEALPGSWNAAYAGKDVARELDKLRKANAETAEDLREMEVQRLDRMLRGLWTDAVGGDTSAVDSILRIQRRRAKLLGLDAAERLEVKQNVNVRGVVVELRGVIMGALDGFPEARQAVADALAEHGEAKLEDQHNGEAERNL